MKTLSLTAFQRNALCVFVQATVRGGLERQYQALTLFGILRLNEAEKERVGWREIEYPPCPVCRSPGGVETALEHPDVEFELEIERADFNLLVPAVNWEKWQADEQGRILDLLQKIKAANE